MLKMGNKSTWLIIIIVVILMVGGCLIFCIKKLKNCKVISLNRSIPCNSCPSCPSPSYRTIGLYQDYISGWKQYESADKKISFKYPKVWTVNDKDRNNIMVISTPSKAPGDFAILLSIQTIPQNAISMDEQIKNIKNNPINGGKILEQQISLGTVQATRLDGVPSCFSPNQGRAIELFIDKKDYYVRVSAQEFNDPLFDFPIEYLLSTIRIY